MATYSIHQAKTNLSKLIAEAEAGKEVVIARGKTPVAKLTPVQRAKVPRTPGAMKGKWPALPDLFFFDPLPEDELRLWEGAKTMRLLVDTHVFFWWSVDDHKLSRVAADALGNPDNDVLVSAVVAWELAAKTHAGRWPEAQALVRDLEREIHRNHFEPLPITLHHALAAGILSGRHCDPFDRMLAAQANIERGTLITADAAFRELNVEILW